MQDIIETVTKPYQPKRYIDANWMDWLRGNLEKGVSVDTISKVMLSNGFSMQSIEVAMRSINNEASSDPKAIPKQWLNWMANNLLQGVDFQKVFETLIDNGFDEEQIYTESQKVISSPLFAIAKEAKTALKRRDWLLSTMDDLARLDGDTAGTVDRIDTPAFAEFIKSYYSKHRPVVLQNGISHWEALKTWTPAYFAKNFGDRQVQIQFDRETDDKFELNSAKLRKTMSMAEFVELIDTHEHSNNFYMTANNTAKSVDAIREAFVDLGDFGEGYRKLTDDPTFNTYFWMGPKGTFTPMHFDLTNNMLVQIYGSKKVTLIPAMQTPLMYNTTHVFTDVDFPNVDEKRFPLMKYTTPIEVVIEAGEALFIPIGWWHCVEGLEKSISISFTNFNAPNHYSKSFKQIK